MATDRLVLISDVHVDYWEEDLPNEHAAKRERFVEFFDWVIEKSGAKRLIINGDLVDIPQKDGGPILPRYRDIADKLREVVGARIKLGYVIGNHDSGLVGLDVDLPQIQVAYPHLVARSGNRNVLIEHGHLQDPWLWDYARTLAKAMLEPAPDADRPTFLRAPTGRAAAPPSAEFTMGLNRVWQAEARRVAPDSPDVRALIEVVQVDLAQDYRDVTDATKDRAMLKARAQMSERVGRLAATPAGALSLRGERGQPPRQLLERLVQTLYSGPHWRQVARTRAAEVTKRQPRRPITGVIMGHTHFPDEWPWRDQRRECQYVNSGSWRGESADMVIVEDGEMQLLRRKWRDPWPQLM